MPDDRFEARPIATVESSLTELATAPKQAGEGAPQARLVFAPEVLDGLRVGDDVIVLTWLHRSDRDVLRVHPRGDPVRPVRGVFSTRSRRAPTRSGCTR